MLLLFYQLIIIKLNIIKLIRNNRTKINTIYTNLYIIIYL